MVTRHHSSSLTKVLHSVLMKRSKLKNFQLLTCEWWHRRTFIVTCFHGLQHVVTFDIRDQACLKPICQQTWRLFLNLLIAFFLLYSVFSLSRSTFVFPLHLAWIYEIRNLKCEAHCFLTTLKDDNLHHEAGLSNWRSWTTMHRNMLYALLFTSVSSIRSHTVLLWCHQRL